MPGQIDWKLVNDATAKVKKRMQEVREEGNAWPRSSVDSECVFYLNELAKPSWKGILKKAQDRRKSYGAALASLADCAARLKEMKIDVKPIETMFARVRLSDPPAGDSAKTRKNVTESLLEAGVSLTTIDAALNKLPKKFSPGVTPLGYIDSFIARKENLIVRRKPELLKSLMAAILAEAVAKFNLDAQYVKDAVTAREIGEWSGASVKALDAAERAIYRALAEKDFAALPGSSAALATIAQKTLDEGVLKGAAALLQGKAATAAHAEAWGEISLELADLLRTALRGLALALFLGTAAGEERTLTRWARSAAKLPYGDLASPGKSHALSELAGLQLRTGQGVSVRGRVKDIIIVQVNKGKSLSLADIVDGEGNHLTAVLPYIKIDSCGLGPGSSVRITGVFDSEAVKRHLRVIPNKHKPQIAALNPQGLIIDRLNSGELARVSWRNWVTRELGFMFTAVPNGLNISWSWQAGGNGPANQLCFGTWCGR